MAEGYLASVLFEKAKDEGCIVEKQVLECQKQKVEREKEEIERQKVEIQKEKEKIERDKLEGEREEVEETRRCEDKRGEKGGEEKKEARR